jgi:hypothetical protein
MLFLSVAIVSCFIACRYVEENTVVVLENGVIFGTRHQRFGFPPNSQGLEFFHSLHGGRRDVEQPIRVLIPYEIATIPFGQGVIIFSLITSWVFWRRNSYPIGHCQSCGYNLQGNESGKCPECGKGHGRALGSGK